MAFLLLLAIPLFADDAREEKIRKTLETLPNSYQKELPSTRRPRETKKQKPQKQRKVRESSFSFNTAGASAIVQIILYIGAFVIVVLFIIWLINSIRNRERNDSDSENKVNRKSSFEDDDEPDYDISDADALALKGELTEAIHYLYLEVISWLQKRGSIRMKKSLTNREILRASSLSIERSRTLGSFIHLVEDLYFGDFTATMEDYEQSKEYAEQIMRRSNG